MHCLSAQFFYLYHFILFSGLRAVRYSEVSGDRLEKQEICIGDSEMCPGSDSGPARFTGFAQDLGGEVYVIGYLYLGSPEGAVYQIMDPSK